MFEEEKKLDISFYFICIIPDRIAFVSPGVEHWLEREITQWFHHEASI